MRMQSLSASFGRGTPYLHQHHLPLYLSSLKLLGAYGASNQRRRPVIVHYVSLLPRIVLDSNVGLTSARAISIFFRTAVLRM